MSPRPQRTPSATAARRDVGHRVAAGEGDRLREQLLDAAEAQLIERGSISGVSLRQVARDVGVSATAVYLHFEDKDDLFLEVCTRRFEDLGRMLREARAGLASASERLRASGEAYVRFGMEHPEQYAVLFGGAVPMATVKARLAEDERVGLQVMGELAQVVAEGVQSREFRAVDPMTTTVSLWALVHGLVSVIAHGTGTDREIDPSTLVAQALALVIDGLRA